MPLSYSDALVAPFWLLSNALLVAAAWRAAGLAFPDSSRIERAMHALLAAWAWITASAIALGTTGCLSGASLLGIVACGAAVFMIRFPKSSVAKEAFSTHQVAGWSVVAGLALGLVTANSLLEFPTDWDSLMYHIPLVDQWLHAHSLYAPDDAIWHFPGNNELLTLWMVSPFSGDFLAAFGNLPSAALLVLGAIAVASELKLSEWSGYLAALAMAGNSVVMRQLCDNENDIAVAALFVACVTYCFRFARRQNRYDLLWGAASAGLLAGVKYYALAYVAAAALGAICAVGIVQGGCGIRRVSLAAAAGIVAWGGYWYARNMAVTGTPLYPFGFSDNTDVLTEMRQASTLSTTLLGSGQPGVWTMLMNAIYRHLGPAAWIGLIMAPSSIAWLCFGGFWPSQRGADRLSFACRLALGATAIGAAAAYGLTPFVVETEPGSMNTLKGGYLPSRFCLSLLAVTSLSLVVTLDDVQGKLWSVGQTWLHRRLAQGLGSRTTHSQWAWRSWNAASYAPQVLFGGLIFSQLSPRRLADFRGSWIDVFLIGLDFALAIFCLRFAITLRRGAKRQLVAAAAMMVTMSLGVGWLGNRWAAGFTTHYDKHFHTSIFSRLAATSPGETRVCCCTYQYYPFLGRQRQFRACRPFLVPTYESLLEYLQEHDSTHIATTNHDFFKNGRYVETKAWLDSHPERFERLEAGSWLSLYRVRREVAEGRLP